VIRRNHLGEPYRRECNLPRGNRTASRKPTAIGTSRDPLVERVYVVPMQMWGGLSLSSSAPLSIGEALVAVHSRVFGSLPDPLF
jgi:hypothetical protein